MKFMIWYVLLGSLYPFRDDIIINDLVLVAHRVCFAKLVLVRLRSFPAVSN